jgi:predicted DNA-binding transcriptional regulator AlpA
MAQPKKSNPQVTAANKAAQIKAEPPKTAGPLRVWVRIGDLKAAGIAASWTQLYRLIRDEGFPRGKLIGRNTRAWDVQEIETWIDGRPDFDKAKQEHSREARAKRNAKREARADEVASQ